MKVSRALISVSNKEGIVDFVKALRKHKIEIISTGGTAKLLEENNVKVMSVSDYTGFPEILDGRVKTLHPKIYGALLAKQGDLEQVEQLKEFGISKIDMVVVNLYPFEATVAKPEYTLSDAIENIDIGGVSLLRAASKNYRDVVVITDPKDCSLILEEMNKNDGEVSQETRIRLAVKAFSVTAHYDGYISNILYRYTLDQKDTEKSFPPTFHLRYRKLRDLRYGENPHQEGAFYIDESILEPSLARAEQLAGKELSFNNIYDLSNGLDLVKEFEDPASVIIKHANPCGVGRDKRDILKAFQRAFECDPASAFGGVVVMNREVTEGCAKALNTVFFEALLAPAFDKKALQLLSKKKNLRLLTLDFKNASTYAKEKIDFKKIVGGLLVQYRDIRACQPSEWKVVGGESLRGPLCEALEFSWKVVKHVKSNAIVIANRTQTLGIGVGQVSRVESVRMALQKAQGKTKGAVLASDAFFPFRDSIDCLEGLGIAAVIQPGGSIRDEEVIAAAKEKNIPMIFTNVRHFKH